MRSFASDNNSGVHPNVMEAIIKANSDHSIAYGGDDLTLKAIDLIKNNFGKDCDVFFVFNGTAANVLSISALLKPYEAVICASTSHLNTDECGAPEKNTHCKLITIETKNGKLTPDAIEPYIKGIDNEHHVQPKMISITQSTEYGTVYTIDEIKKIAELAHSHNLYLHIDGARIYNAAAHLNATLKDITFGAGADVVSLGGTKNGLLFGEAVIFKNIQYSGGFKFIRKQSMQLASKMRFIAAQFIALFSDDLWLKNALHSNKMARLLSDELKKIPQIKITQNVEANSVFAIIPPYYISLIQQKYFFYVWNEKKSEVRLMTSFDTTEEDISSFVSHTMDIIGVEKENKCKICDNIDLEIIFNKKKTKKYFYCKKCGYIYVEPTKLPDIDQEKQRYLLHNNAEENSGYPEMFENLLSVINDWHNESIKTALDFGCGPTPVLANLLRKRGIETDIYDPFFAPEKVYENKTYDLITCTEVFEHLFNPVAIMELFEKHLNKNGIIAITTHFHPSDSEKFAEWWYIRDETHISFYTHKTFEYLASLFGLEVLLCTRKNICIIGKTNTKFY